MDHLIRMVLGTVCVVLAPTENQTVILMCSQTRAMVESSRTNKAEQSYQHAPSLLQASVHPGSIDHLHNLLALQGQ